MRFEKIEKQPIPSKEKAELEKEEKKTEPLTADEIIEFHNWGGSFRVEGKPISDPMIIKRMEKLSPEERERMKQYMKELVKRQQHELKELLGPTAVSFFRWFAESGLLRALREGNLKEQERIEKERKREEKKFWEEWINLDTEEQKYRVGRGLQLKSPEALHSSGIKFKEMVEIERRRMRERAEEALRP